MAGKEALDAAARALARRDRSTAELDGHLEQCGVDAAERAAAIETMVAFGYVDDERLAANRASALAERGYGDEAIRFDLERRGVDPGLVVGTISALEPEAGRASAIAARRGASIKTARLLVSRGFSADSVESALGSLPDP
jgi:SOS response regulatory protein OraA/RecX